MLVLPRRLLPFVLLTWSTAACGGQSFTHVDAGREVGAADGARDGARDALVDQPSADSADGPARPDAHVDGLPAARVVDPSTLDRKVLFGYQGWFSCPGDGSAFDRWIHWFRNQQPTAASATFDAWPDVSELGAAERCPTQMSLAGGATAALFSSARRPTVVRHFAWMKDADLDGVFLQRFPSEFGDPAALATRDRVLSHVRAGAEQHGRVFAIMYDVSGMQAAGLIDVLKQDWAHLVDDLGVTQSPRYLHHGGRPVLGLWGFGFTDRPSSAAEAQAVIDWFKSGAPLGKRVTLVGGVPSRWRTRDGDAKPEAAWDAVYKSFDVLSPWAVGRYADDAGADTFRQQRIAPDLAALATTNVGYMPVVFPGFSWTNLLPANPLNQIPRRGGAFYWRQVANAIDAGAKMIYVAMFDEVDEGTAMFKLAPTQADLPTTGSFLALDADGLALPSDWYLRLGRATGRVLRGELPPSAQLPANP